MFVKSTKSQFQNRFEKQNSLEDHGRIQNFNLSISNTQRRLVWIPSWIVVATSVLVAVLAFSQNSIAQTVYWDNSLGGIYENPNNWVSGTAPSSGSAVNFLLPGQYGVRFLNNQTAMGLTIGNSADVTLRVDNANYEDHRTYSISGDVMIEDGDLTLGGFQGRGNVNVSVDGLLRMDGGSLSVVNGTQLTTGGSELNVLAGSIEVGGTSDSGERSRWAVGHSFHLGGSTGNAHLTIAEGGQVGPASGAIFADIFEGSSVSIEGVDAAGNPSQWEVASLTVEGGIDVIDGARLVADTVAVFFGTGGTGVRGEDAAGNPSHWNVSDSLRAIGGIIRVEDGARVSAGDAELANLGRIHVTGTAADNRPSELEVSGNIGLGGVEFLGFLEINRGRVTSGSAQIGLGPVGNTSNSEVSVQGLPGEPGTWENDGDVSLGGSLTGAGSVGTLGLYNDHADVKIGGQLTIWDLGTVQLDGGALEVDIVDHANGGQFDFDGGSLTVNQFSGDLNNNGGTLAPGDGAGATLIIGDYTQQPNGKLAIDIGGHSAGGTHDLVSVGGTAIIGGTLELTLLEGFTPEAEDEFVVFVANNLIGLFGNVTTGLRLDTADGRGSFQVHYGVGSQFDSNQVVLSDFEPSGGASVVTPDSMTVIRGSLSAGTSVDLTESDDVDVSIRRSSTDIQSRTQFEVTTTSPIANPGSMTVTLEGSVFARTAVIQSIELYDYDSGSWEQVDSRNARRFTDLVSEVTITVNPARFVESGSNEMKARVLYRSANPRQQFSSNTDQFSWTVGN